MKWANFDYVIKMIWLWTPLVANFTKVNSTKQNNVKYDVIGDNALDNNLVTLTTQPSNQVHPLQIRLLSKSTSSIVLEWGILDSFKINRTLLGSKVEYFLKNGKFSSHMLQSHINTFTCEQLQAATKYTVCVSVYLTKNSHLNENESIDISRCFITETIPYIRIDSILVLLIVLGYYVLMGFVGFCQWKRQAYFLKNKYRRSEDVVSNGDGRNSFLQNKEETQGLTVPSCSIEET